MNKSFGVIAWSVPWLRDTIALRTFAEEFGLFPEVCQLWSVIKWTLRTSGKLNRYCNNYQQISMVHLGQELLLAVFYSRTLFHEGKYSDKNLQMLCSSCGKLCICRATKHSKLLWLGNVGNTANVTFSEVDSWIPDDWWWWWYGNNFLLLLLLSKYYSRISPYFLELWIDILIN